MSKILVTGGLGFIGRHLAEGLSAAGHFVRILDCLQSKGADDNIEVIRGDIRDRASCLDACKHVDVVFHTAGIASIRRALECPDEAYNVNVEGTRHLLDAAIQRGVPLFVYSSSGKIYGNSIGSESTEEDEPHINTPYAETKYKAELLLKNASSRGHIRGIALRYFSVYGPRQKMDYGILAELLMGLLNGNRPVVNADEDTRRDFTYIDDVVGANMRCLEADVESYEAINVASGRSVGLREVVSILNKITGKNIQPAYKGTKTGMCDRTGANISKAGRILGYRPGTALEEGLTETVRWLGRAQSFTWERKN